MTQDKNKGISAIAYNHLNLPQQVNKGATDYILYTYDATGRKLAQQVFGATPKTTDYVGELIFEGNILKFINTSEGRVLPDGAGWEYQYHLKDHLGNVRVTFTTKAQTTTTSTADFEAASNAAFTNYNRTGFDLVDHTDAGTTKTYVQWLQGGSRTGLAKSLSVMPGDQVTISAWVKYMNLSTTTNANPLITSLASAFGVSAGSTGDQLKLYNGLNAYAGTVANGNHDIWAPDNEGPPKVFVTILFFDKEYNFVDAAWDQVSTVGAQTSTTVKQPPHDLLSITAAAKEAGFAYVFVSNEHPYAVDVYADDVTVTQAPSQIVGSNDYYPFGLTFNSYQRENSVAQDYKYNGKELQDELSLNWLDYGARMYMSDIGRWGVVDPMVDKYRMMTPYNYVANNPLIFIDPTGKTIEGVHEKDAERAQKIIQDSFKGEKAEKLKSLFTIKGNKFNGIDKKDFKSAVKGLDKDSKALAKGYFKAINSNKVHQIEVVSRNEPTSSLAQKGGYPASGAEVDKDYGGGSTMHTKGGTYSIVVSDSTDPISYLDTKTGSNTSAPSSPGEIMAHEVLGHGRHWLIDSKSIQMSNIFLRATESSLQRDASDH
jgi:RHS repeat-associated protein